ncbi:Xanthine permease [Cronobacter turicensis 564]|nr:Xanthine permease [Cronobacter turicensis 564]
MAALFGTLMLASCTEMVISRVLHLARRIITPLVSGVVVMIIGLSLIQVGLTSIGGGYAAMSDHTGGFWGGGGGGGGGGAPPPPRAIADTSVDNPRLEQFARIVHKSIIGSSQDGRQ